MKKILIILPIIFLMFCSFVDPSTIDVYEGNIQFVSSEYDVTRLSGDITYYLDGYNIIGLSSGGHLFNASDDVLNGTAIIGGNEYNIRLQARSGLEIEQKYTINNYTRTTWVQYNLTPDIIPSQFQAPDITIMLIFVVVFILVAFLVMRGILT